MTPSYPLPRNCCAFAIRRFNERSFKDIIEWNHSHSKWSFVPLSPAEEPKAKFGLRFKFDMPGWTWNAKGDEITVQADMIQIEELESYPYSISIVTGDMHQTMSGLITSDFEVRVFNGMTIVSESSERPRVFTRIIFDYPSIKWFGRSTQPGPKTEVISVPVEEGMSAAVFAKFSVLPFGAHPSEYIIVHSYDKERDRVLFWRTSDKAANEKEQWCVTDRWSLNTLHHDVPSRQVTLEEFKDIVKGFIIVGRFIECLDWPSELLRRATSSDGEASDRVCVSFGAQDSQFHVRGFQK